MQRFFHLTVCCFLSMLAGSTFAQSKREVNTRLGEQFRSQLQIYDSLDALHRKNQQTINALRWDVRKIITVDHKALETRNNVLLKESGKKIATLNKLGIRVEDTLHKTADVLQNALETMLLKFSVNEQMVTKIFEFRSLSDTVFPAEMKRKAQNAYLEEKIRLFRETNTANSELKQQEEACIAVLKQLQEQLSSELSRVRSINGELLKQNEELVRRVETEKQRYYDNGPKGFSKAYEEVFGPHTPAPEIQMIMDEVGSVDTRMENAGFGGHEAVVPAKSDPDTDIMTYVDELATFPGGTTAMRAYVAKNLAYPAEAAKKGIEGKCYLRFVVSKTGNISNVTVVRGVPDCPECDKEAVRVVKGMPDWIPAKIDGKTVNSYFNLPFSFKL